MRTLSLLSSILLFIGVTALTTTCGGGGSGGATPPSSPFFGSYRAFVLTITDGPPVRCESSWGTITADGEGAMSGSLFGNIDGSLTGPSPTDGFTTRVEADNSFTWQVVSAPGVDLLEGSIRPDGAAGLVGITAAGEPPGILAVARVAGTYGLTSLNAPYHACGFAYDAPMTASRAYFGRMTFDGAGGGEHSLELNQNGTVLMPLVPTPLTYTMAADGLVTISTSISTMWGGAFAGGDLVLVGGSTTDTQAPRSFAMVRPSTAASLATFSGTYAIVGLQYEVTSGEYTSLTGTATADGAGSLTVAFTENKEGTIATPAPDTVAYSVAPDGGLTVLTGGESFLGGVSPTGDYAVLGGATTSGPLLGYFVLVRQ